MTMGDVITNDDIHAFIKQRPHVFILGAGASKAALPKGDRNGMECPVMEGFLGKTGLKHILEDTPYTDLNDNLETVYSTLYDSGLYQEKLNDLEHGIRKYFDQLAIPFEPTVYDYLLLSLRDKDYIFSFNWDDLLVQAYFRVRNITKNLPKIYFLHGNIAMGYCDCSAGLTHIADQTCPKCGKPLIQQPLLYPVKHKDYHFNSSISNAWHDFLIIIKECSILTIFGYGAPPSDAAAIELMQKAFSSSFRRFDAVEIIDVKPESQLLDEWDAFLKETNYHVDCYTNLFDSIIARFPRRSIEGYCRTKFECWWGDSGLKLKEFDSVWDLGDWLQPLIDNELKHDYSVICKK